MPQHSRRFLAALAAGACCLAASSASAVELPVGSRFLGRGGDGWFWYESLPAPPPPPEPAPPPPPGGGSAAAEPIGPAPLTAAWFRLELERFRDQAIDQPTPENVRAYLYLQKVMLDKADAFARTSQQVASADPYLDAITERPLSPFAANATSAEATARRGEVLRELATSTGLLFVVDGKCGVCVRAADVLLSAQRQYGFTLLTVSLDGKAPAGLELPAMGLGEHVLEDYATLRLSLKAHPLALLRDWLTRKRAITARDLWHADPGRRVTVCGLVLVRQRPGSAKGVIFATLEDETGFANLILWPNRFEQFRATVMTARLLAATGTLQREGRVIHVIAERLTDLTPSLRRQIGRAHV